MVVNKEKVRKYVTLKIASVEYLEKRAKEEEKTRGGFESIPRTRFVRIFSRFQRVSISSFRPAVKPKPFDR
ncbi:TPA: hypothetical protein NBW35_002071 [Enterococcus faecium]|nr:hypothetical protein [Enterococcus faecium]